MASETPGLLTANMRLTTLLRKTNSDDTTGRKSLLKAYTYKQVKSKTGKRHYMNNKIYSSAFKVVGPTLLNKHLTMIN